jgi:hypothetical protein
MGSVIFDALSPSAVGASSLIILAYIIFHFLSKPTSNLKHLPSLGDLKDPYLYDVLIEGYQKVSVAWPLPVADLLVYYSTSSLIPLTPSQETYTDRTH